jgi:hypothetical protein
MDVNFACEAYFFHTCRVLTCHKIFWHGTDGLTSPPKESCYTFLLSSKTSTSAKFEPVNLGSNGKHANHQTTTSDCTSIQSCAYNFVGWTVLKRRDNICHKYILLHCSKINYILQIIQTEIKNTIQKKVQNSWIYFMYQYFGGDWYEQVWTRIAQSVK